MSKQSALKIK